MPGMPEQVFIHYVTRLEQLFLLDGETRFDCQASLHDLENDLSSLPLLVAKSSENLQFSNKIPLFSNRKEVSASYVRTTPRSQAHHDCQ